MTTTTDSPWTGRLRLVAVLLFAAAAILLIWALPFDSLLNLLRNWIEGLGPSAPIIFALVYAVWAVLFLPGSALTLAGGAIFGLGVGMAAVLTGATLGAALSFLIGRYLARDKVSRLAKSNPKFGAIDRAIAEGGWKIVAMLRLSPAIPFNVQNYLYGLTAVGFWPCILASAVFMAPGTFLYVYLGHIAGEGLAAASGADAGGRSPAQWAMLAVGLAATVVVTVYVTKLASKALNAQTDLDEPAAEPEPKKEPTPKSPRNAFILAVAAACVFALALFAYVRRDSLKGLFGPPEATLNEAYERREGGPDLDHSPFDALLREYVDDRGMVDYRGLAERQSDLNRYIASIARAPFDEMGRDQKLALLINAYNAFTLRLILDHYPVESIQDIPSDKRWDDVRWSMAGTTYSLNQIEHEEIRPNFAEPRIHFVLVCAAMGCPPLRNEAYVADRLEAQLEDQARYVHNHDRWFSFEPAADTAALTQLYNWYGGDFAQQAGSVAAYAARYSPALKQALDSGESVAIRWLDYDWSLNEQ